jgi:hypothetical protein
LCNCYKLLSKLFKGGLKMPVRTIVVVCLSISYLMLFGFIAREPQERFVLYAVPESKGCIYPTKEIKETKVELKHVIPYTKIHTCNYDDSKRLISVKTYNFEVGYQMKKPTHEIIYHWVGTRLSKVSFREASHGQGEVDIRVLEFSKK